MKFMDYFFNSDEAESTLACVRSVPPTEKARTICEKDGTLDAGMMEAANIVSAMNGVSNDKYSSAPESKQIMVDTIEAVGYGTPDRRDPLPGLPRTCGQRRGGGLGGGI